MRDRLIELIAKSGLVLVDGGIHPDTHLAQEALADHLLSEGVIVPKVKIGDELYELYARRRERKISKVTITHFKVDKDHTEIWGNSPYENTPHYICDEVSLGCNEWVYLTREEAERALERRDE